MRGVSTSPLVQRLFAMSRPDFRSRRVLNDPCWIWQGTKSSNGYGLMGVKIENGWQTRHAHRISYENLIGPVPTGLDLDHLCRRRICINPNHLEPVTRSENLSRSPLMGRQKKKTHCPRGHLYSGTNSRGQRICHKCLAMAQARHRSRS